MVRRLVHWIWQHKGAGFTSRMIADQFSIDSKFVTDILNEIGETFKVKMTLKKKGLVTQNKHSISSIKRFLLTFFY